MSMLITLSLINYIFILMHYNCSDMEYTSADINNYRMAHESDKEWHMRRAFLLAHRGKFSDSRLRCLSSCYINVECYGCRYPNALMRQLEELSAGMPRHRQ